MILSAKKFAQLCDPFNPWDETTTGTCAAWRDNVEKEFAPYAAEIADLKRQLRQALAQVEIVDRALGDPGNTSSKVALDAYVQEKVESERKMWQSRESEEYRQALLKRAVEAEKRAEKAESNMAKAVLAESEWWHPHAPMHHLDYMKEFGKECPCIKCRRLAANRELRKHRR